MLFKWASGILTLSKISFSPTCHFNLLYTIVLFKWDSRILTYSKNLFRSISLFERSLELNGCQARLEVAVIRI